MLRGLYTAASGLLLNNAQSETIQRNIENMQNPGYREESERITSFPRMLALKITNKPAPFQRKEKVPVGIVGTGVYADRMYYKSGAGMIRETERPTDLALNSQGYFVIDTLGGERYTRNGHFQLDPSGMLRTAGGNLVLGTNGPLGPLPDNFKVTEEGTVLNPETGEVYGRLRVVNIPAENLQKDGITNLFIATEEPQEIPVGNIRIHQGFIEESNVDLNSQMVKMMTVVRSYSANQKVVQTNDNLMQKAANDIGKV